MMNHLRRLGKDPFQFFSGVSFLLSPFSDHFPKLVRMSKFNLFQILSLDPDNHG